MVFFLSMTKNKDRLKHALHNESACNYLSLKEDMSDWVITTSFYASLHFLAFKIFPFNVPAIGGKTTTIDSVDHYYNYNNTKKKSKHELLSNLAFEKCPKVSEDYDWLLDLSMTARYKHYTNDKEIANKAVRLMQNIKKECCTVKEISEL